MPFDITKVKETFTKLIDASVKLNEASDQLGTYLTNIDTRLNELHLGVEILIPIPDRKLKTGFGYGRIGKEWGMFICEGDGTEYIEWPINRASRHLRIAVVDYIPALLEALRNRALILIAELEMATILATEFSERINK